MREELAKKLAAKENNSRASPTVIASTVPPDPPTDSSFIVEESTAVEEESTPRIRRSFMYFTREVQATEKRPVPSNLLAPPRFRLTEADG